MISKHLKFSTNEILEIYHEYFVVKKSPKIEEKKSFCYGKYIFIHNL